MQTMSTITEKSYKSVVPSYTTVVKTPKRSTSRKNADLQAKLRKCRDLYLADKRHKDTIQYEYNRVKDQIAEYMDANDFRELDLVGTDFSVILKERSHWIYPVETQRLEAELAFQKKIDKDTDQATNDPTLYVSALFRR